MMFVIYEEIFRQAGYKKGDLYPAMVLMGFMLVCGVAFSLFPFRGWCLMTVGLATRAGITINMGGWIITEVITLIVTCVGWILIMFITPGCKVDNLKEIDITQFQKEVKPLTPKQKAALIITVANVVGCIFISFAGGSEGWRLVIKNIGVYGWVLLMIVIAMIWHVDGEPVLTGNCTAFVSIMQGCDMRCSYCIVPSTRGEECSRPQADILREAQELVARGVKEITLLGQIVNRYGRDEPIVNGRGAFVRLLEALHEIDGLERIRFT
ncbi:MAG: radical SAM protein, partial [Peptococcaceae bacterium]|nr:radical SAM protein [Peptococcaceae bacterium]